MLFWIRVVVVAMVLASAARANAMCAPQFWVGTPDGATIPTRGSLYVVAIVRDCRNRTLANFVATASSTPTVATPALSSRVFYFGDGSLWPSARRTQSGLDGRYFLMDVPPPNAYLQVWGFRDANELASSTLTLIAELAIPVTADSAIFVEQEPHATD